MKIDANQKLMFVTSETFDISHVSARVSGNEVYEGSLDERDICELSDINDTTDSVWMLTPDEGTMRDVTEDVAIAWLEYMSKDADIETFIGCKRPCFVERYQDGWMEEYSELNGIDWRDF